MVLDYKLERVKVRPLLAETSMRCLKNENNNILILFA